MKILKFPNLSSQNESVHGVATTDFGNMSFRYGEYDEVRANRKRFFDDLGILERDVVVAQLEHGKFIVDVTEADRGMGIAVPEDSLLCDVLVTAKPDTFLFIVVADCMALLFFDPVRQVCALAHAGWRGVEAKVPQVTVAHLQEKYGCDPRHIFVGISPSLKADSAKFKEMEQAKLPGWEPYVYKEGEFYHADISRYAYDQLVSAGIPKGNIEQLDIDTRVDKRFFSHRRSDEEGLPEGRFGVLVGIKSF